MGRSKLDTVSDFARQGYFVRVTCVKCGKVSDWNAIELMGELYRRRISMAVEQVEKRLRCSTCGARQARLQPALAKV